MPFTDTEINYLASQRLGRLATIKPNGTPQVDPVGYTYNRATATIEVRGFNMATSRKFRNLSHQGNRYGALDAWVGLTQW